MAPSRLLRSKAVKLAIDHTDENREGNLMSLNATKTMNKQFKSKKRTAFGDVTNAVERGLNLLNPKSKFTGKKSVIKVEVNKKPVTLKEEVPEQSVYSTPTLAPQTDDDKSTEEKFFTPSAKPPLPNGVVDFDAQRGSDPVDVAEYAFDIFVYYASREAKFPILKYLDWQTDISRNMRAVLVDWLVEIQESFGLNHETLYLAIKILDLYLSKVFVTRETLQLVGTTALVIACKYEERIPPCIVDFLYLCDDAYTIGEVLATEKNILTKLNFELSIPISYEFLRRYARCEGVSIETLTLARYILEASLMDYQFIDCSDSVMAAAALLLALKMKGLGTWSKTLEYYSGLKLEAIYDMTYRLNDLLQSPPFPSLLVVHSKYSHSVFFSVAGVPVLENLTLP